MANLKLLEEVEYLPKLSLESSALSILNGKKVWMISSMVVGSQIYIMLKRLWLKIFFIGGLTITTNFLVRHGAI